MVEKFIRKTSIKDPYLVKKLVYFLYKTEGKDIIYKHWEYFSKMYVKYVNMGLVPEMALDKAKEFTFKLGNDPIYDLFLLDSKKLKKPNMLQIMMDSYQEHYDKCLKERYKKKE